MSLPIKVAPTLHTLGERAVLLRWQEHIDLAANAAVHTCAAHLRAAAPDWIEDVVPAYASLAVVLDVARCIERRIALADAVAWVRQRLSSTPYSDAAVSARLIEIPVTYGGNAGPDLDSVASASGLPPDQVIARHCATEYRVGMLGFAPGFPYLIGLDPALATPRRRSPRRQVHAGSVAIGGAQTGIYPRQSPGGWQLIGRTTLILFDPQRQPPSLLAPGDRVRFVALPAPSPAA